MHDLTDRPAIPRQIAAMSQKARLALAVHIVESIDDPQMFAAVMLAKRMIEDHAHDLARAAFEAECG